MATYGTKTSRNFQRRLTIGFTATLAVTALIAVTSTFLLHDVISKKDLVIYDYGQDLILTERLRYIAEKKISLFRGYFISREQAFLDEIPIQTRQFHEIVHQLHRTARPAEARSLDELVEMFRGYDEANAHVLTRLKHGESREALLQDLIRYVRPFRQAFETKLTDLVKADTEKLEEAKQASLQISRRSFVLIVVIAITALTLAAILAFVLGRTLNNLYLSAVRATRLREEVLGIVAHDLKNPISAIQMNSKLLLKAALLSNGTTDKVAPVMERIDRVTQQMQRLIDDLLIADKIESGLFTLNFKKENLNVLLNDAVESAKTLATESGLLFEAAVPLNLGEVVCDRVRLMQVLSNLLGNAIKFTPRGGQVTFEVQDFNRTIVFFVKDTGAGVTSSQLPLLFERRWQAQATSQKGNGLGLYIAKSIVVAHRGRITVESHCGHGTVFRVEIPRSPSLTFELGQGMANFT